MIGLAEDNADPEVIKEKTKELQDVSWKVTQQAYQQGTESEASGSDKAVFAVVNLDEDDGDPGVKGYWCPCGYASPPRPGGRCEGCRRRRPGGGATKCKKNRQRR